MTYTVSVLAIGALVVLAGALAHLVGQAFRSEYLLPMRFRHDPVFLLERGEDGRYVMIPWAQLPLALAHFARLRAAAALRRVGSPVAGLRFAHRTERRKHAHV
jgi:hypothetical protein